MSEASCLLGKSAQPFAVSSNPYGSILAFVNGRDIILRDGGVITGNMAVNRKAFRYRIPAKKPRIDSRNPNFTFPVLNDFGRLSRNTCSVGSSDIEMSETVGRGCVNVHAVIKCEPDLPVAVEHQPADIVARNARPVAIGMGVTAELTAVETAQSVVGSEPDESYRVLNDAIDVIG